MSWRTIATASVFLLGTLSGLRAQDSYGDAYVGDTLVVRKILDAWGRDSVTAASVTKMSNGRVVWLSLENKVLGAEGLKILPEGVGTLTALEELHFPRNVITDLPPFLKNLTKLRVLNAADNELESLPEWLGQLHNLEKLDFRNNEFSELPASLFTLKKLKWLQLWGCRLTEISPDIVKLTALEEIYLERNRLKTLPVGITTIKTLKYIDYASNLFCELPPVLHEWMLKKDKKYRQTQRCWETQKD